MGLFDGKNKEIEIKREIFSMLDTINYQATQNQLSYLSKSASMIKHKIKDEKLDKKKLKMIRDLLNAFKTSSPTMNFSIAQNAIEKVNKILIGADVSPTKESMALDKNSEKIAQLSDEISQLNSELSYFTDRQEEAIRNNQKNIWAEFNHKAVASKNKLSLKQSALEQLMIKNSTIDVKITIDEIDKISKDLANQASLINTDDLGDKIARKDMMQNEVSKENDFIGNLIVSGTSDVSEFEKARENYLMESKKDSLDNIEKIKLDDKE